MRSFDYGRRKGESLKPDEQLPILSGITLQQRGWVGMWKGIPLSHTHLLLCAYTCWNENIFRSKLNILKLFSTTTTKKNTPIVLSFPVSPELRSVFSLIVLVFLRVLFLALHWVDSVDNYLPLFDLKYLAFFFCYC